MTRQRFGTAALILTLALGILLVSLPAGAQPPGKMVRVGFLIPVEPVHAQGPLDAFRRELAEIGYLEGKNVEIVYRYALEGDRLREFAAELVRLNVNVIVTVALLATQAARTVTRTTPIVFVAVADPVGDGLAASLARPGGNLTGLTHIPNELYAKHLELLKAAVPEVSRVVVLWNPDYSAHREAQKELAVAAQKLRVELQPREFRKPDDFDSALSRTALGKRAALLVMGRQLTFAHRTRIAQLASKNQPPAIALYREFAEAGGLVSYGASIPEMFRRAAHYVDKILKGARPADLPVEQPTRFELVINLKTAKALGLTIPQSVLIRADQVIQ